MCSSLHKMRSKQFLDTSVIEPADINSRSLTLSTTKECIRALGMLAGSTPFFGSHLQAVLDLMAAIVTKLEVYLVKFSTSLI